MDGVHFWPWWWSGAAVAVIAVGYPWLSGSTLGVSSTWARLVELVRERLLTRNAPAAPELDDDAWMRALLAETERAFGPAASNSAGSESTAANLPATVDNGEDALKSSVSSLQMSRQSGTARPYFLLGIAFGGLLAALSTSRWPVYSTFTSLGDAFDVRFGDVGWLSLSMLALSGVLIGIGTRMSGGCTSGHGITGMARAQPGSLLSTAIFWSVALAVFWAFAVIGR